MDDKNKIDFNKLTSETQSNNFNKVNDLAYNLHTEYWKYKINSCEKIKQY